MRYVATDPLPFYDFGLCRRAAAACKGREGKGRMGLFACCSARICSPGFILSCIASKRRRRRHMRLRWRSRYTSRVSKLHLRRQ